ncbi:bridge-like lipid transfer protein family member 2 isoform X2 [Dysidea avara]|uniref:bridge-like lipid transfer protein family member 2 isoform X2 n=1 Tax=Dysidea avara TaxID=196820 RepID=UPI003325D8CE
MLTAIGIVLWTLGIFLNTILLLTCSSIVLWGIRWYLRRFRGITVTVKSFRFFWIECIHVQTAAMELMLDDIWLSVRLFGQRSLFKVYVKEIHFDKHLQTKKKPSITSEHSKMIKKVGTPSRMSRLKLAVLFRLAKKTELSVDRLHIQMYNEVHPDLMLSVMILGGVNCTTLPSTTVTRCLGLNLTANNVRSTLLLDPEIPISSTDDGMLHLSDVMCSVNLILNINTMADCDRRMTSLHIDVLPTRVSLLQGFDDHLMKLLSVHKSPRHSKEVVKDVDKSLEHNVTPTARVKGFLSMKLEMLLQDIQVVYSTHSPSERQLSLNISSLSLSTNQSTDSISNQQQQQPSPLYSLSLQISEARVCHSNKTMLATLKRLRCGYEYGATVLKNYIIVESLHSFYSETEVNFWVSHLTDKLSSRRTKPNTSQRTTIDVRSLVSTAFKSPTTMISNVEISDCSFSLILPRNVRGSKEPICDVVIASVELTSQCLEPEDCNGTDQRTIRASVRFTDGYVFVPSDKNSSRISRMDRPELLPSTKRHVWGRLVTLGNLGSKATLSVELIPNDDRHQLFQVNSLSLSTMTHVLAAEWSHSMFTAVSHLLKHYSTPKGILKKQQALSKPDSVISDTEDSTNTKQSVVSKHLKIPWCSLREDLEELDISFNFLDINLFMYDKSPSDPSLLLRIDGCCVKTPEVYSGSIEDFMLAVHCNSLILLPFSVDHLIESFLCSSMSSLPRGLLEIPSFNCSLPFDEKAGLLLEMESLTVNWSTHFHCTVNHTVECVLHQRSVLTKLLKPQVSSQQSSSSPSHPVPIKLKSILSKLPISLDWKVNELAVHLQLDRRAKVSCTMKQATLSAKTDGIVEVFSGEVAFTFDKHKILTIERFSGQCLDECEELIAARRRFEQSLECKENLGLGLTASKVLVSFPFNYKFTLTFQKLMKVKKFIQSLHKLPIRPSATGGKILLPDIALQVDELNFQLLDDPYEMKLGTNFELQRDEQQEREKRFQALESAMEKQRQEHGALLPAKKVQALYEALEQKDAQIYCKRAKEVHESESGPQESLFLVSLFHAQLSILSDRSVEGVNKGSQQIRRMDPDSPFPEDMQFDTLLGRYIYGEAERLQIQLHDYPQQFHETTDFTVTGCIVIAEPLPNENALLRELFIEEPWENMEVTRTLTPLKIYYDLDLVAGASETALGVCYDPCFAQINLAFENLIPTTLDPSKPLPYWDKIRLFLHGKYHIRIDHGTLILLASRDPYDAVKHMDWEINDLDWTHTNDGRLTLEGAVNVYMHTASKYDDCRSLHFPHATCNIKFDWNCQGNPHDHHSLMPCLPDRIPPSSNNYDTYAKFRSKSVDWSIDVDVENVGNDEDEDASCLLYASTLRWVQSYYQVVQDVSRPIRKGALFKSVKIDKPTFFRSIRSINFSLSLPVGSMTYWGSFSQQRGVKLTFKKAILKGCYVLTLKPFDDGLVRRPDSKWEVVSLIGEADDITVTLLTIGEAPPNKEAEQETSSLRSEEGIDSHHLFTTQSIKYTKSKNNSDVDAESDDQQFHHQLLVNNTRFSWTFVNRSIINNLFDAYTKAQTLKKNLSAEAARSIALILDSQGNKSFSSPDDGGVQKIPSTELDGDGQPHTPRRRPHLEDTSSGSKLLKQLLMDTSDRVVHHVEERAPSDPYLKGRLACSQDDVTKRNWFIELRNTQLALQGIESEGFVLVTSAISRVFNYEHKPQWREGDLRLKKSWVAKVEDMQYFATLSKLSHIPWVTKAVVSSLSLDQPIPSPTESTPSKSKTSQASSVDALLGKLGPDSSSEQLDDILFMSSPVLCRSEAVGGMVDTDITNDCDEPVQLQRITSRCFCQIFYVNYSTEADRESFDKDDVPPVTPVRTAPAGITTEVEAVNTFTIRHPSVEVSTTSFQHAMIRDIINNLLLYKQSRRKEELGKLDRLRFSLQLGNIKDYKDSILTLQNTVRKMLAATRKLEKDMYLAQRSPESTNANLQYMDRQLTQHKTWLADASLKLGLTIRLLKECQLKTVTQLPHGDDVKGPEPIRRIEVWLDDARWWLTQDDGQLHMCDITFTNCCYNQVSFSDDSAEHRFELGTFKVCNHLSNCPYPVVLYPHDPNDKKLRVDRDISLRIYCRDQAPVGGISVKEHFEINVIPLAVKISEKFYNAIEKFFFPKKTPEDPTDYTDDAHVNLMGHGSALQSDIDGDSLDGHILSRKSSMRSTSKASITAASSTTSILSTPTKSKDTQKLDDVEQMKERAQQTNTFIYIKIPKIPLCISYKAEKGTNLKDVQDFMVTVPTLEYHNRNWTWTDMLMEVKKVYKQHIIQKGIKTVFGIREEDEAANYKPTLSIGGIDASKRLLMGKKYVKNTVKASRRLFKKSHSKSSAVTTEHSDDEGQKLDDDEVDDVEQSDV